MVYELNIEINRAKLVRYNSCLDLISQLEKMIDCNHTKELYMLRALIFYELKQIEQNYQYFLDKEKNG